MRNKSNNIRIINIDSFFLMLIIVSGLLLLNNPEPGGRDKKLDSYSPNSLINQGDATILPSVNISPDQQSSVSGQDVLGLYSFETHNLLESKKILQKIATTGKIRNNFREIPFSFFLLHQFPDVKDYPPFPG